MPDALELPASEKREHAERRASFLALRTNEALVAFTHYQADLLAASEAKPDEASDLLARGCDPELCFRLLV